MRSHPRTTDEIRESFLRYFVEKGHTIVESASLLTKNDPTLLFVNSGMVPFKEVFAGRETRPYNRATSCQKCLRVSGKHNDFEQIGLTPRHHTFFEMLGNFSLGDYFKREAIEFAWEFLTERLGLDKERLWVSVHRSDDEAVALWESVTDLLPGRIVRLGDDTNLWAMGDVGPWGYCSEIFFYGGAEPMQRTVADFLEDDGRFLEIWNLVFMQFFRDSFGKDTNLPKPCIDTGMGLERVVSVVQGVPSNYDTESLREVIRAIEELAGVKYDGSSFAQDHPNFASDVALRVIADHARAAAFLIADGIIPGNDGEGYVLRRIIRRAIRFGAGELGLDEPFLHLAVERVVKVMGAVYPELQETAALIDELVRGEELKFRDTLKVGLNLLMSQVEGKAAGSVLSGEIAFKLYDTFGFPLDLTQDVLRSRRLVLDQEGFDRAMKEQRERSRSHRAAVIETGPGSGEGLTEATVFLGYETLESESRLLAVEENAKGEVRLVFAETPYYPEMGGQVGDSGEIKFGDTAVKISDTKRSADGKIIHFGRLADGDRTALRVGERAVLRVDAERRRNIAINHSATHLLNAALHAILGSHVIQRGSYLDETRFRFDFSHHKAVSAAELAEINAFVNDQIRANHEVVTREMAIAEAKAIGAVAAFDEKYGEVVRVIEIGEKSLELCGGTHVARSGDIGFELVLSEGGVSAGVRRIEGVAGINAAREVDRLRGVVSSVAAMIRGSESDIETKITALLDEIKQLERTVKDREGRLARLVAQQLLGAASSIGDGASAVVGTIDAPSTDVLLDIGREVCRGIRTGLVALGATEAKAVVVRVTNDQLNRFHAGDIVKRVAAAIGAKGGGKPDTAILGGLSSEKIAAALEEIRKLLRAGEGREVVV